MDPNNNEKFRSSLITKESRERAQSYQRDNTKIRRQREEGFFDKSFDYRDYIFSPEGFEGTMLAIYFITLPYLLGVAFLFLFIADANYEYFLQFELASFFIIWAIGYETFAGLMLVGLFLAWLKYLSNRSNQEEVRNKPNNRRGF